MKHRSWLVLAALSSSFILLQGCFILGIHTKLHNPRHASKYPKFPESTKLLGNSDTKFRKCFDVKYYELNVTVDEKKKYLKGMVEMLATSTSSFDTIQLDLYANLKVNNISYATLMSYGETGTGMIQANYTRKYGAIFIPFKQKAGEIFKIRIEYEGSPIQAKKAPWDGGFVWKEDKEKKPWIGVACQSEGASLWWPCKDVTNDEPDSISINVTTNKDLVGVANGRLSGQTVNGNEITYQWKVSNPINLYDVTIYVGNFKLLHDSLKSPYSGKTLPINHYVLPYNFEKAEHHLRQAKPQLLFYEKMYGEYPWYKDGYKLIESPYEGMEHQSAIAYGNGYKNGNFPFDYIVLHESAHEWWGNAITASDFADIWLQEGFATYSEALYVEATQGKGAYLRYLLFYRIFIQNKWPMVGPTGYRYFYYKNSDCYQKGAWTLHTLRTQIANDSVFFDIIRTYYDRNKFKTITSQDFINVVNEKTGEDYTWFFNHYLHKRETPFLEYYWDGSNLYYRWKYVADSFKMPAEVILDGLVRKSLFPTTTIQKTPISETTYKELTFNNYVSLFGLEENKKLKKVFDKQKGSH